MIKKLKTNKGITLIALVITIIVLLILAGVAISMLSGENGILNQAAKAKEETELAEQNEIKTLNGYEQVIDEYTGGEKEEEKEVTIASLIKSGEPVKTNTPVKDIYGNTIVVPAGFKITEDADTVPEGIVIEDVSAGNVKDETTGETTNPTLGSQFVWIPVGDVYTTIDEEKTSENTKVVTLGRYSWSGNTGTAVQTVKTEEDAEEQAEKAKTEVIAANSSYYEVTPDNEKYPQSTYENARAKDLAGFLKSTVKNGGYYIARYEAGIDGEKDNYSLSPKTAVNGTVRPQSKKGLGVWNSISQTNASILSQAMYTNDNFESDLINSYAWDTAIVFIQKMAGKNDYAGQTSLNSGNPTTTGTSGDVQYNIYDMASNVFEWSTETCSDSDVPCAVRGGYFNNTSNYYTSVHGHSSGYASEAYGFRPLLYVGLGADSDTP